MTAIEVEASVLLPHDQYLQSEEMLGNLINTRDALYQQVTFGNVASLEMDFDLVCRVDSINIQIKKDQQTLQDLALRVPEDLAVQRATDFLRRREEAEKQKSDLNEILDIADIPVAIKIAVQERVPVYLAKFDQEVQRDPLLRRGLELLETRSAQPLQEAEVFVDEDASQINEPVDTNDQVAERDLEEIELHDVYPLVVNPETTPWSLSIDEVKLLVQLFGSSVPIKNKSRAAQEAFVIYAQNALHAVPDSVIEEYLAKNAPHKSFVDVIGEIQEVFGKVIERVSIGAHVEPPKILVRYNAADFPPSYALNAVVGFSRRRS